MPNIPGNIMGIFVQQFAVIAVCYQQPFCFIFVLTGMGSSGYGKLFQGFLRGKKNSWEMLL